ncbi:MAG: ABC transporter permease [Bacteroidota bacterium]
MVKHYFSIAFRNLLRNRVYSFINIGGLAMGMAVALLISLWIRDELYFDHYHQNYNRIAKIRQHVNVNGEIQTEKTVPYPLANELRTNYPRYFKYIVMSSNRANHILSVDETKFTRFGVYLQPEAAEMLTPENAQRHPCRFKRSLLDPAFSIGRSGILWRNRPDQ